MNACKCRHPEGSHSVLNPADATKGCWRCACKGFVLDPKVYVPGENCCARCGRPQLHKQLVMYPVADGHQNVCKRCWSELRGRGYAPAPKKRPMEAAS